MIIFAAVESSTDREFIESLYITYSKLLYCIAKRYVHDEGITEDIIHDAFLKLIPKISLLRSFDCCRLRAYLVSTVRNTAITHAVKLKAERTLRIDNPFEKIIETMPNTSRSLEDELLSQEMRVAFSAILETLEADERFLLEAKYFLHQTDREIAEKLQVKPASIRMMLTRVRRKVLKKLQEVDNDER